MPSPWLLPWLRLIGPLESGSSVFILPDFRPAWFGSEGWSDFSFAGPRAPVRLYPTMWAGYCIGNLADCLLLKTTEVPWILILNQYLLQSFFPPFVRFICNRQPSVMIPYFLFSLFCFFLENVQCSLQHTRITTALLNIVNKPFTLGLFCLLSAFWPPFLCTKSFMTIFSCLI